MTSITARALVLSIGIVTCLTLVGRVTESPVLFYLLYPGAALSLLITGGHGGTRFADNVALAVGLVANIIVYALLCGAILSACRKKGVL
jgi:hypothetical protein